jgi:hypothetical protein
VVGAVPGKQKVKTVQCWPANCGRILGFRVPVAVVVCIIVLTLRQKMVIVLLLRVEKRILSLCCLDLHGQRNSIFSYQLVLI